MQITNSKCVESISFKKNRAKELCRLVVLSSSFQQKAKILRSLVQVCDFFRGKDALSHYADSLEADKRVVFLSLIALDQLTHCCKKEEFFDQEAIDQLLDLLVETERFYQSMGGLIGYYASFLSLLLQQGVESKKERKFLPPRGLDFTKDRSERERLVEKAISRFGEVAEIYPVGGAGDRLNLINPDTGTPQPAAMLCFDGHTLLAGLIRKLQAREYLHFKQTGQRLITPVVLMTSSEKDNDRQIRALCEKLKWFGRGEENFFFLRQPLVPVLTECGDFAVPFPYQIALKPGGHGVIWKLALDAQAFDWLRRQGRRKLLVQQINNPIAGTGSGVLAFLGAGLDGDYAFGFCSCGRVVGTAEGMNVLQERKTESGYEYCLKNIEYTDLKQYGLQDIPSTVGSIYSAFPCNTNILFADIDVVAEQVAKDPVPGMLINMKSKMELDGKSVRVGRIESTMQNIADGLWSTLSKPIEDSGFKGLKSYITFNRRARIFSATKHLTKAKESLVGTPEGAYFDHLENCLFLLSDFCHFTVPVCADEETYRACGPNWIFRYHPALGPLFSVIGEKISSGKLHQGAELELEITELDVMSLEVEGSFRIFAENLLGVIDDEEKICYGEGTGKAKLHHVKVRNRGIDREEMRRRAEEGIPPPYWTGNIVRRECAEVYIRGNGEFVAENVVFNGPYKIEVRSGHRLTVYEKNGELVFKEEVLTCKKEERSTSYGSDES